MDPKADYINRIQEDKTHFFLFEYCNRLYTTPNLIFVPEGAHHWSVGT